MTINKTIESESSAQLITSLRQRDENDRIRVLDAASWVKGCSSLGRFRYAVLVGVGKSKHYQDGGLCLVDIKDPTPVAAPRHPRAVMPRDNAERVVEGARKLSPFLGQRMTAFRVLGAIRHGA